MKWLILAIRALFGRALPVPKRLLLLLASVLLLVACAAKVIVGPRAAERLLPPADVTVVQCVDAVPSITVEVLPPLTE